MNGLVGFSSKLFSIFTYVDTLSPYNPYNSIKHIGENMRTGIRVTRNNIHMLADEVGVSAKDLYNDMVDAKLAHKRAEDKRWAYEFFNKDEKWYVEIMKKVQEIKKNLPKDISPTEETIAKYGWITKNGKKNLSIPMMYKEDYPEYAHAIAVEYILTRPDSYHSAINWN